MLPALPQIQMKETRLHPSIERVCDFMIAIFERYIVHAEVFVIRTLKYIADTQERMEILRRLDRAKYFIEDPILIDAADADCDWESEFGDGDRFI